MGITIPQTVAYHDSLPFYNSSPSCFQHHHYFFFWHSCSFLCVIEKNRPRQSLGLSRQSPNDHASMSLGSLLTQKRHPRPVFYGKTAPDSVPFAETKVACKETLRAIRDVPLCTTQHQNRTFHSLLSSK